MPIDLLEYEFALVGAPLADWERAQMLRGLLSADDFNDDRCAAVWRLFIAADGVQDFIVSLGQHKLSAFATGCSDGDYAMMPVMWDWVAGKVRQALIIYPAHDAILWS